MNPRFSTPSTRSAAIGLVTVFGLGLSACGSDDAGSDEPADSATTEAMEEEAPVETEAPEEAPVETEPMDEAPEQETPDEEDGPDDEAAPAEDGPVTVDVVNFQYDPNPVEVAAGTEITWTNLDSFAHTVTNDGGDLEFDSGTFGEGEAFSFTFDEAGEFAYICTIHNQMVSTVVVS